MRLAVREMGAGPPLVLLHGLFGNSRNFGTVQTRLAASRRVIALDLRNHGQSPHAADMRYTCMAADVAETLHTLAPRPCAVLGHSMGGKVAMRLALDFPDTVSRLIVADIAPTPYPHSLAAYAKAMLDMPLIPGMTRAAADRALQPSVPDARLRAFLLLNFEPGPTPRWRIGLAEIAAAMPDIMGWTDPDHQTSNLPCLFLLGGNSGYVTGERFDAAKALFPRAEATTIPGAGHWLHVDAPEIFCDAVTTFLDKAATK